MDSDYENIVSEGDIPKLLTDYSSAAIYFIEKEEFENALNALSQSEELLEAITTQGGFVDPDFILLTIHNSALCFQKLGLLDDCASYLDGCLYNIKSKFLVTTDKNKSNTLANKLKKAKYECRAHIQLCAVLSQLNKHEAALNHAKLAVKKSHAIINDCLNACIDHLQRHRKIISSSRFRSRVLEHPQYKLFESPHYKNFHDSVIKSLPILEFLDEKLKEKNTGKKNSSKPPKIELRNVLGVHHHNDWIYTYNIEDVMNLHKITLFDLKSNYGIQSELTRDLMFDKIFLLMVSHFCLATEIRFLAGVEKSQFKGKEGKNWHKKAIDLARHFIPHECPLYNHIKASFEKNYKNDMAATKKSIRSSRKMDTSFRSKRAKTPHIAGFDSNSQKQSRPRSSSNMRNSKQSTEKRLQIGIIPQGPLQLPPEEDLNNISNIIMTEPTPKPEKYQKFDEFQDFKHKEISYPVKYSELSSKLTKITNENSIKSESESINPEEIIISSYDLYGIYSDSEDSQKDSTGGKNNETSDEIERNNSGTGGGH
ncbi:unnamed protein product [Blepharisma stoltei]|uniref:Uncharacterized protein n=1 Tax=Blepharisma stoltei TaxID=1481888 RepID=A0AAU9IAU2_9CILI|nr:unnamed protein product [Blepharisma stoltei]